MALPGAALWWGALLMKAVRLISAWRVALQLPAGYVVRCVSSSVRGCVSGLQSAMKSYIIQSLVIHGYAGIMTFLMLHVLDDFGTWHLG